jgi:uncharacterized integral membrane protein (TIGR00697 family)
MSKRIVSEYRQRKNWLFIVLTGIFLTNALVAEIIGVKIFSLEALLKLPQAQIPFWEENVLDFNLTAGVLIWPIVFVTTDLINEYYGKPAVKRISLLGAILILYAFLTIWITTQLPPADFWVEINKAPGENFDINYSFSRIFQQGLNIIVGSVAAFIISQLLDASVFEYLRKISGKRLLWLRATGSTLVSQLIDSFVVLYVAFYLLGGATKWSLLQVFSVGLLNYIYKFSIAVLLTPLLYLFHAIIDKYLGEEISEELVKEAAEE